MRYYFVLLVCSFLMPLIGCNNNVENVTENSSVDAKSENRILLAKKFRSEATIVISDEDEEWIGKFDNKKLVDAVFDAIYDGRLRAYDLLDDPLSIEDIKRIESSIDTIIMENIETGEMEETVVKEELERDDITKIFLREDWYFDEDKFSIEKDVVSMTLTTKKYDLKGNLLGYEVLFVIYFNGKDPLSSVDNPVN